nr:signal recognition particle receptor subunit alpha [Serratia marcescens]
MFENLTDRLSRTLRNISGRGRLTEENIKETLREVRMALLEADVALPVVRDFINRVKESAVGHEVNKSLTPGQEFVISRKPCVKCVWHCWKRTLRCRWCATSSTASKRARLAMKSTRA